jgi:hypothetical protein
LLGDATAFCCVDRHILSEASPFPEKVLVFKQDEKVVLDMKRYAGPNMVEFDTTKPHQQYLSCVFVTHSCAGLLLSPFDFCLFSYLDFRSLKPLGLNCMLMSDFKGTGKGSLFLSPLALLLTND